MRAAERGQEIVQSDGIREVLDLYRCDKPPWPFGVEKVIGADSKIENVARRNAIGIVIVVFLAWNPR
jgi:hypothetical protein